MFKLTKPCSNCPFRKGWGERFSLGTERCLEILNGDAFQCHKTVDYSHEDDPYLRQGKSPQQCAGVMSLLHRAGLPNQIMQVAERLGAADFSKLDHSQVYADMADAIEAHSHGEDWVAAMAAYEPRVIEQKPTRARMPDFVRAWERWC